MLGKRQKTLDFFIESLEDNRQSNNRTIDKLIIISFLTYLPIVTIQDEMEVYRPIYGRVSPFGFLYTQVDIPFTRYTSTCIPDLTSLSGCILLGLYDGTAGRLVEVRCGSVR